MKGLTKNDKHYYSVLTKIKESLELPVELWCLSTKANPTSKCIHSVLLKIDNERKRIARGDAYRKEIGLTKRTLERCFKHHPFADVLVVEELQKLKKYASELYKEIYK